MEYEVTISESALRVMTLATLEAYALGDGRRKKNKREVAVETLGYIWGFSRISDEKTFVHLDAVSVSISAKRTPDSVLPNERAVRLKAALMERWAPHLTLMGNFHSHPYTDLSEVKEIAGYEFSDADEEWFLQDDYLWEKANDEPVMIAMTVCKLSKVNETASAKIERYNINSFDVGEYRFWVNVAIGFIDDQDTDIEVGENRCWTGNKHSPVELRLDSKFYNYSSDRLED